MTQSLLNLNIPNTQSSGFSPIQSFTTEAGALVNDSHKNIRYCFCPGIQSQNSISSSALVWRKNQGLLPTPPPPPAQSLENSLVGDWQSGFMSNTWHFPESQPLWPCTFGRSPVMNAI